jgi:hypothetical protein
MFIIAAHDTIRGTAHHHRKHGHIDEGIPLKIELTDGSRAVLLFFFF